MDQPTNPMFDDPDNLPVFDLDDLDAFFDDDSPTWDQDGDQPHDDQRDTPPAYHSEEDPELGTQTIVMAGSSLLHMEAVGWMLEGLRRHLEVISECTTPEETRLTVEESRPDLLIIDAHHDGFDAITLVRSLRVHQPVQATKIMVLAFDHERGLLREAMEAGANGFVLTSTSGAELAEHIDKVLAGDIAVSPQLIDQLFESIQNPMEVEELTRRELQVLDLLEKDMTSASIAMVLDISVRTVQKHLTNMYAKAGVDNREDMIAFARRRGFGE